MMIDVYQLPAPLFLPKGHYWLELSDCISNIINNVILYNCKYIYIYILYNMYIYIYIIWLVVWNLNFMTFHILGISKSQLTNSIIFQRGRAQPPTSLKFQ